jgi:hypothetical protein
MNNIKGNLFEQKADAICITTNGFTKANKTAVMGRGCAAEAAKRIPQLPNVLGGLIHRYGNRTMRLGCLNGQTLVSLPVKPITALCDKSNVVSHMRHRFEPGDTVPGWACVACPDIIVESCRQLVAMTNKFGWKTVILPRPGCGAGELDWSDIEPLLQEVLDHRFSAITF